jgi:hypothetical protein
MSNITITGTLQADGVTLALDSKVALPPGRVTVTLGPAEAKSGPTVLEVLDRIHQEQRQQGRRLMSEEEMAAEIARMRAEDDEYEERWRQIWSQTGPKDAKTETP